MNEEIDEFSLYHQDFTTASEWEVFVARIEEILYDWKLGRNRPVSTSESNDKLFSDKLSEEIHYYGSTFTLSYYNMSLEKSTNPQDETKSLSTQILSDLWEAGTSFINDESACPYPFFSWYGLKQFVVLIPNSELTDESQIKLIFSSVHIAFANVQCRVPIFVKLREHWQECYRGIFEDNDLRTSFDVIHLKRIPSQCYHLNGLLNLFKGKIASPVPLQPVQLSAKFSYNLKDVEAFKWRKPHSDEFFLYEDEFKDWVKLPYGATSNPIKTLTLNVMWPRFQEDAVIDSANYSDFDPLMAPVWNINIKFEDNWGCLLSDTMSKMIDLLSNEELMMNVLGLSRTLGLLNPLHKITEPPNTISKLVKAAIGSGSTSEFKGPIPDEQLMPILYYVFPDAVENSTYAYPKNLEIELNKKDGSEPSLCGHIKSGPVDSMVWRLGAVCARVLGVGGLPYLSHLWYEITQELQYRWEHRVPIPGVAPGPPSARSCLLHQKLQLLNLCVSRAGLVSSDEEYYDCSDSEEVEAARPSGRLARLGDAVMKNGAPLYVPKTQEPAPKTEEQLEEDAELLLRLGEGTRASELRARMLSAALLSDMEAFKAANPGAQLCDFVRWYSPRDWLPDDGGSLGERMLLPGNPWSEAWTAARAVPAVRQRRLFDETREAERCLHFLRARSVGGVAELLLPGALRVAADTLERAGATVQGALAPAGGKAWDVALREIEEAENSVVTRQIVTQTVGEGAAERPLDAAGRARVSAACGPLPTPAAREFVLRARDSRAPQLMRARLATDMMLVSAFTQHTVL